MNNQEVVQEAIDQSNLPGVEEWRPPGINTRTDDLVNCVAPPIFSGVLDRHWTPPVTIEVEKKPDFEVKVWKASNGYMLEVNGEKYVAKNPKEMAALFQKAFEEE